MEIQTFAAAGPFLEAMRPAFEAEEALNNLMYGLVLRLVAFPERIKATPYYALVREEGVVQLAALMTPPNNLLLYARGNIAQEDSLGLLVENLAGGGWSIPGVLGPNMAAQAFAQAWQARSGAAARLAVRERAFELREVIPPPWPAGGMRLARAEDLDLLAGWMVDFRAEAAPHDPFSLEEALEAVGYKITDQDLYLWEDGQAVTMVGRSRPTPHGYCIGPVYTPRPFRGRGYASALTARASQLQLEGGKQFTALFTDLSNPTSNSIYQKIGYRPVCDFDLYRFSG